MDAAWFVAGVVVGSLVSLWACWDHVLRRPQPKLEITVTPEVLHQINRKVVSTWLEAHGLTWMPKGVDFLPEVKP